MRERALLDRREAGRWGSGIWVRGQLAWPEHLVEFNDVVGQVEKKTNKKTRLPRLRPSAMQIELMEVVLLRKGSRQHG